MKAKLGKACLLGLEVIAFCVALVAGIAFFTHWKLSHGGLSLNLLNGPIASSFEQRLAAGSDVSIGNLVLKRDTGTGGGAGPVQIAVSDLAVTAPDGGELIRLPEVAFRLRTGDLIRGNVMPRYVEIAGAQISISRTTEGRIDFGILREADDAPEAAGRGVSQIRNLLGGLGDEFDSLFEGAVLSNTSVTFTDQLTGQVWSTKGAKAEVWQTSAGYSLTLDAPFSVDGEEAWLKLDGSLNDRDEEVRLKITADSAPVGSLVEMVAGKDASEQVSATLTGSIEVLSDYMGKIIKSHIDLRVIDGEVRLGENGVPFDEVLLRADYLPAQRTFDIDELDYSVSGNEGVLQGFVSLGAIQPERGLEPEKIEFNLAAQDLLIDLPGITPEALPIAEGDFAGRYLVDDRHLVFDSMVAAYFDETAEGSLEILFPLEPGQSAGVVADAAITGEVTLEQVMRGWPLVLAHDARNWIVEQMPGGGYVSRIDYEMDMPRGAIQPATALGQDMLKLTFDFRDASAYFVPGVTPLTRAKGSGVLRGNSFHLTTDSGRVGPVEVTSGEVNIPAFMPHGSSAYYKVSLAGDIPDILAIIDEEPLGFMQDAGYAPELFTGHGTFDFEISHPMLHDIPDEDYIFSGSGAFDGAGIEKMIGDYDVENATGMLELDNAGMKVEGVATLAGQSVDYVFDRTFEDIPDVNLTAHGVIDSQAADDFGVPLRQFLHGRVPYTITAHQTGEVYDRVSLNADLTGAQIALDMLNYGKAAGARGQLQIDLVPPDETAKEPLWQVSKINLDTDDLDIYGSLELQEDGELISANVQKLFIRDRADLRLSLDNTQDTPQAAIIGEYANIDLFGDSLFGGGGEEGEGEGGGDNLWPDDLRLSVVLDRLELKQGVMVHGYDALLSRSEGALTDISMSGDFGEGDGSFIVKLERGVHSIGRDLRVETDNLGAVAGGLFDIASIEGGSASYDATLLTDGPVAGTLQADGFRVVGAPLIARLLSAGSLTGLSDILNGEGIEFNEVRADIQYDEGMLNIVDARATGPSLGLSVAGDVDFDSNSFDVNGAIAPAYGVNSMLGNIPGFGELLVSRKGEGIVAFSYMIDGPVKGPTVTVNALSLFTPGIFRRIFEPIRASRATTAELLEEAVKASQDQAAAPQQVYAASTEQMEMLRDSLSVFRERLEELDAASAALGSEPAGGSAGKGGAGP